jgi:hypothetical protein
MDDFLMIVGRHKTTIRPLTVRAKMQTPEHTISSRNAGFYKDLLEQRGFKVIIERQESPETIMSDDVPEGFGGDMYEQFQRLHAVLQELSAHAADDACADSFYAREQYVKDLLPALLAIGTLSLKVVSDVLNGSAPAGALKDYEKALRKIVVALPE